MERLPRIILLLVGIGLLLVALACGSSNVERPKGTPGPGPTWSPQEAIEQIDELPRFFDKDAGWNASFDPYEGRRQLINLPLKPPTLSPLTAWAR